MLNQCIVVGRLVENPITQKNEDGKEVALITLAVSRSYKNKDGVYEIDFIPCVLYNGIAKSASEYCLKGDVVGIKGSIQSNNNKIELIAEKVTFLSSKKPTE